MDRNYIQRASEQYGLPVGYINYLIRRGVISAPFSHIDELILDAFSKVWRSETLLKIAISKLPKRKRKELIEPMSRLEKFIYTRLCSFYTQGKVVTTNQLLYELDRAGFKMPKRDKKLKELKKKVQSLRRKCKRHING